MDGGGSRLAVIQHGKIQDPAMGGATLDVGEAGQGLLTVRNGGLVEVLGDHALLAVSRPGDNQVATSKTSSLIIESGGTVSVDSGQYQGAHVLVAGGAEAIASLDIRGNGSALLLSSNGYSSMEVENYGAALKIGVGGHGSVTVREGGYIRINGQNDRHAGLSIAENGGTGTFIIDDSALAIVSTRTATDSAGIKIGSGAGSSGEMIVINGATVTLDTAAGVIEVATNEGTEGSLSISGPDSLVTGGAMALIGTQDPSATVRGGAAELVLSDGGTLTTDNVVVGQTGRLELSGGVLDADLILAGTLDLSPDVVTVETFDGAVSLNPGARIALDAPDFGAETADLLIVTSDDQIDFSSVAFTIRAGPEAVYFGGDSFVFAWLEADHQLGSYTAIDTNSGRTVAVVVENHAARIEAILGSSVSLKEDGTIKSVALPSLEDRLVTHSIQDHASEDLRQRYPLSTGAYTAEPAPAQDVGSFPEL